MNVLMLHGINHNMFGKRDPKQYGTVTLAEIDGQLAALGASLEQASRVSRPTASPRCASAFTRGMPKARMPS